MIRIFSILVAIYYSLFYSFWLFILLLLFQKLHHTSHWRVFRIKLFLI